MAISIFQDKKPRIGPIRLDASILEEHELEFLITREPIENQTSYTDHILELPQPITIQGVITNHTDTLIPTLSNTRHTQGWRRLLELGRRRLPFTVVTSLARYRNTVIRKVNTTRDKRTSNALIVTIECETIQLALVDEVANLADVAQDIAAPPDAIGDQGFAEL